MIGERDTGPYWPVRMREWYPNYHGDTFGSKSTFKGLVKDVESLRARHRSDIFKNPRYVADSLKDEESEDVAGALLSARYEFRVGGGVCYLDLNINRRVQ